MLKVNEYGGRQTKVNEKRQCFERWETLEYNNWFDIYLEVGAKKYKLKKTKIHVFKQGVNDSDDKAVVIYNNHREKNSKYIHFIGE